jgi:hypothetical protein
MFHINIVTVEEYTTNEYTDDHGPDYKSGYERIYHSKQSKKKVSNGIKRYCLSTRSNVYELDVVLSFGVLTLVVDCGV